MAYDAGEATLRIVPSFKGVIETIDIQAALWGKSAGKAFVETWNETVKGSIGLPPETTFTTKGEKAGGAFANSFKARVRAALRDLPEPRVGLDATELDARLADIRGRLKSLGDTKIGVDIDDEQALAELGTLHRDLLALSAESPNIQVRVDVAAAIAKLEAVRALARSVSNENFIPVEAVRSLTVLPGQVEKFGESIAAAGAGVSGLNVALVGLALAAVPAGAALIGVLAGAVSVTGALTGGLAVVALGAKGVAEAVGGELTPALHELQATAARGLLPGVEHGLHSLLTLVPELDHFVGLLADTLGGLAAEAGDALASPYWQQFFKFIESEAGPLITQFAHIVGNLAHGFAGLLEAFAPVTHQIGNGLEHLSERFANFGERASSSKSFQSFLAYVQTEGPQLVKTFEDVGAAFIDMLPQIAELGAEVLKLADDIAKVVHAAHLGKFVLDVATGRPVGAAQDLGSALGLGNSGSITGTVDPGVAQGISDAVQAPMQAAAAAQTAQTALLGFYAALSQSGAFNVYKVNADDFVSHTRSVADNTETSAHRISKAIVDAVTPAVTGLEDLANGFAAAKRAADRSEFNAIVSHQSALDAEDYAKALAQVAKNSASAADQAKSLADAIDESTAAGKAAKASAEAVADSLAAKAKADQAAADAAQKSADRQTSAYKQIALAAQAATADATAAAQALIASVQQTADSLLAKVSAFKKSISAGLTQGTDLASIWQSIAGTDADGNPVAPTLDQLHAALERTLANVKDFAGNLATIADEGGSKGLITQILGLDPGDREGFAQLLVTAGPAAVKEFSSLFGQIHKVATTAGDDIAESFFGDGVKSMENLIKGLISKFPDLTVALKPVVAALQKAFTITPVITEPVVHGGKGKGGKGGKGGNSVPGFASGVTDFAGGWAEVGEDGAEYVWLPPGADVYPHGQNPTTVPGRVGPAPVVSGSLSGVAGLGDVTVYAQFGDEWLMAKQADVAHDVVNKRVATGRERAGRGVPGGTLVHLER